MTDQYLTRDKTLEVTCVGHASIMMRYGEQIIHVDPYGDVADYGQLPDADLILITHHHGDHFDTLAIAEIERPTTQIIGSPTVIRELKRGKALRNGSQTVWNEIPIRAVPAYNRISMRSPGVPFHIRGEGNGYLLEIERLRIYIAGDTELIPEMEHLGPIDIAFLPKNLPYTMSDQMFIEAARLIRPAVLYPYHYFEVDRTALQEALPDNKIR